MDARAFDGPAWPWWDERLDRSDGVTVAPNLRRWIRSGGKLVLVDSGVEGAMASGDLADYLESIISSVGARRAALRAVRLVESGECSGGGESSADELDVVRILDAWLDGRDVPHVR